MATHHLQADRATLHGHFSRSLTPVITVDSGDTVVYQTLDAGWSELEQANPFEAPKKFQPRDMKFDAGHALHGPVAIRGARAGQTLEVAIDSARPGKWGWSSAGGFPSWINEKLGLESGPQVALRWAIDADAGTARNQHGREVVIRPFLGLIGMPPPEPGNHGTVPPRRWGGNIDCKELIPGSRLYLPIPVDGALVSLGDGHAVQGDGEVASPALECPMERVEVTFTVHDRELKMPRAETPAGWITFGFQETLDEAAVVALDGMLDLIGERHGIERREALSLASLLVDLHVTQVVNGVKGVHAILPHGALSR